MISRWTWNLRKDQTNRRDHGGLSLADGMPVLDGDPHQLSRPDTHPDGDRWQTIGMALDVLLLFVVHTEPDDRRDGIGRIISVRRASPQERKAYEEGAF
ncbi:BrnT family toxin [Acidisoma cladoniae]|uniref:BrnT family toxin n=1 Tax=Acidisoma cladoniae TaxID=3040935 RepID=UPI00254F637A|nr:BrnT family toxin [Acidisoma sp. PAMC 29798]